MTAAPSAMTGQNDLSAEAARILGQCSLLRVEADIEAAAER